MRNAFWAALFTGGTMATALGLYYILMLASVFLPFLVAPMALIYLSLRGSLSDIPLELEEHPAMTATASPHFSLAKIQVANTWDEDWGDYVPWPEHQERSALPRVLIVDDDLDSAALVNQVFQQFGCRTSISVNVSDARKYLELRNIDVIILDWKLGEHERGDEILRETIKQMERRQMQLHDQGQKFPRVITYSGAPLDEISVPESPYYAHVDHWSKSSTNYDQMTARTAELLAAGAI